MKLTGDAPSYRILVLVEYYNQDRTGFMRQDRTGFMRVELDLNYNSFNAQATSAARDQELYF